MHTDKQLKSLGFSRPRPRESGFRRERHLVVGGWKLDWPDAVTRNSTKPRLIVRGRLLFLVSNATWRQMHKYSCHSTLHEEYYFKTLWEQCSRFQLPMPLADLTEFIERVQCGDWHEPHFYDPA